MVPKITTVATATVTLLASALTTGSVANGRRAADAAAGADQPAGVFIETKHFLAKEAGDEKVLEKNVNQNTAHADVGNLGERQAKAVEDDPRRSRCCLAKITPPSQGCQIFG